MIKISHQLVVFLLAIILVVRFYLSLSTFNADSYNNFAWIDSVNTHGWSGLYSRSMGNWAPVNYPPLTLYSFFLAEKVFNYFPSTWQNQNLRAACYKVPSLVADVLIAGLIWFYLPYSKKIRLFVMGALLINPALVYNSVYWGQLESWVGFWILAAVLAISRKQIILAILLTTMALLSKQNAAPLVLILCIFIYLERPPLKKIILGSLISITFLLISYYPFLNAGDSFWLPFSIYWQSLSGQSHQHLASVNALNFWYLIGLNNQSDKSWKIIGWIISAVYLTISALLLKRSKISYGQKVWFFSCIVFMTTFSFTTRMHERHIFMSILMLTVLLPYLKRNGSILYFLLSAIGFYSLHIVWAEMMTRPPISWESWMIWTRFLAGLEVLISLILPWILIKQATHQPQRVDDRENSDTLPKYLIDKPN